MKKVFALLLSAVIVMSMGIIAASAVDAATVYVTISDKDGKLALADQAVTVSDIDGDDVLTVNDALYAAHEQFYTGGAAEGFATQSTEYGLSLSKLWGTANGGSYGYYVNNTAAFSMTDPISENDHIAAFVYTDLTAWSDMYTFFDTYRQEIDPGELTVTLSGAGYDANWAPITVPVEGATILVDGAATDAVTDAEGKATVTLSEGGEHTVSATSANATLVPPVMIVTVTGIEEPTEEPTEAEAEAAEPTEDEDNGEGAGTADGEEAEESTEAAAVSSPTAVATAQEATPQQISSNQAKTSGTNTAAIRTGNSSVVIYLIIAISLMAAAAYILLKKRYEK